MEAARLGAFVRWQLGFRPQFDQEEFGNPTSRELPETPKTLAIQDL